MLSLVLLVAVVLVLIPFARGLIRGPRAAAGPPAPQARLGEAALRPLGSITGIYSGFVVLYLIVAAWTFRDQLLGSRAGVSPGRACVTTGINSLAKGTPGWHVRPGMSLTPVGTLQACILHPAAGQWALYLLTWVPGVLLWCGVLMMILRLVRYAAQSGPFTPAAATMMAQLGWLILAGSVLAAIIGHVSADLITDMVIASRPFDGGFIASDAILAPLRALLPVPALAGAALLSFARLTRAAAVMDEEIQATV